MRPPTSHGLIWRGIALAGTPAIAAPGASYAVDFSRRLKNDELLPPAVADSPTGKIDEHREEESSELRRQAVHGSGAAPVREALDSLLTQPFESRAARCSLCQLAGRSTVVLGAHRWVEDASRFSRTGSRAS